MTASSKLGKLRLLPVFTGDGSFMISQLSPEEIEMTLPGIVFVVLQWNKNNKRETRVYRNKNFEKIN